ncbi:MAG TPA: PDZ domain-containing protein [Vicinamibacterales bacterium]|nr:PDZ domain-containing protein [Vicinamibacterales bacterium]
MTKYGQPVISRETRLLLITIVISVGALWLLARLRFQDRPVTVAPVVPVLAQLRAQSNYDDLARSMSELRPGVFATVAATDRGVAALRIAEEVGVGLVASHLELMPLPEADVASLATWTPRIFDYPRYLVAVEIVEGSLSLRPVFVGSLVPVESRDWNGSIWRLPPGVGLSPGTFLFSTEGLLAGVAVEQAGALSLVPAPLVLESAKKLSRNTPHAPGVLGMTVQPTTVGLAVTWVDPAGPAFDELMPTDIVESVNGRAVANADDWRAHTRNIANGEEVKLRVRSDGETRDVAIKAAAVVEPPEDSSLGLSVRTVPRVGVEVLAVEPQSRADRAGIRPGDLITVFGGQKAPAAAQIVRIFDDAARQARLLVALSRGSEHHVVVLEKIATTP